MMIVICGNPGFWRKILDSELKILYVFYFLTFSFDCSTNPTLAVWEKNICLVPTLNRGIGGSISI